MSTFSYIRDARQLFSYLDHILFGQSACLHNAAKGVPFKRELPSGKRERAIRGVLFHKLPQRSEQLFGFASLLTDAGKTAFERKVLVVIGGKLAREQRLCKPFDGQEAHDLAEPLYAVADPIGKTRAYLARNIAYCR